MSEDWPLVGHNSTLQQIRSGWDRDRARPVNTVIAGPPGSGKTVLGHASLGLARNLGWHTEIIVPTRTTNGSAIPGDGPLETLLSGARQGEPVVLLVDAAERLDESDAPPRRHRRRRRPPTGRRRIPRHQ